MHAHGRGAPPGVVATDACSLAVVVHAVRASAPPGAC